MKSIVYPLVITILITIVVFLAFPQLEFYFSTKLNVLTHYHLQFGLVSLLLLASDIVLPVPASLVMYMNGYVLGAITGATVSLAGLLLGAVTGYCLGNIGGKRFNAANNSQAAALVAKYGAVAILLSRGIPIISESVCIVCGYNKMPFKQYFILNLVGYIPLCLLYAFFGNAGYDKNSFLISFGCSLLISGAFWFLGKSFFKRPSAVSN